MSFLRRVNENDGEQVARSLHSSVQLLYLVIKAIVLWCSCRRCHPRILKSLLVSEVEAETEVEEALRSSVIQENRYKSTTGKLMKAKPKGINYSFFFFASSAFL